MDLLTAVGTFHQFPFGPSEHIKDKNKSQGQNRNGKIRGKNRQYGGKSPHKPGMIRARAHPYKENITPPAITSFIINSTIADSTESLPLVNCFIYSRLIYRFLPQESIFNCCKMDFKNRSWRGGRKGSLENKDYAGV